MPRTAQPRLPGDLTSVISTAPALMSPSELLFLFSLVLGCGARRVIEIGVARGGSSIVICEALRAAGDGHLYSVDIGDHRSANTRAKVSPRCTFTSGRSPDILREIAQIAGRPFDFAFIDGDHDEDSVYNDVAGVLPYMDANAMLLFHDINYIGVQRAIIRIKADFDSLRDCGVVNVDGSPSTAGDNVIWGGLYLLRMP